MTDSDYEDDPEVFRLSLGDRLLVGSTHESRNFIFAVLRRGSLQSPVVRPGISAGTGPGSKVNAQATRAEPTRTVLIKTSPGEPGDYREPAFGEPWTHDR
jgi:hypothetical protein